MLFPFTTVTLAACLLIAYRNGGRRSAVFLALLVWAVGVACMSAPIFDYNVGYSPRTDLFVAGCLMALTSVYALVRARPRQDIPRYWNRDQERLLVKCIGVLGIIGCVLLFVDARASGAEISIGYLLTNLSSIRENALSEDATGTTLALISGFLASCAMLSVIAAAWYGRSGGLTILLLGIANLVLVGSVGLFVYAGRTTLFYGVCFALISCYLAGRRLLTPRPRTLLIGGVALISVWYFSVSWVQTRQGSYDPERILFQTQRASYSPWLAPIARSDPALGVGLVTIGYMASPIPTLAFYVEQRPVPGPFWGGYSYPVPMKAAGVLARTPTRPWSDTRRDVFTPLEASGYFGNVWATWLRDLLIDFGYAGALAFCALFGAFMAWTRNAFERTGALHYHCLEVLACFTFAYGAFAGVLFFTFLASAFFIALGMMFAMRITWGARRPSPSFSPTTPITKGLPYSEPRAVDPRRA